MSEQVFGGAGRAGGVYSGAGRSDPGARLGAQERLARVEALVVEHRRARGERVLGSVEEMLRETLAASAASGVPAAGADLPARLAAAQESLRRVRDVEQGCGGRIAPADALSQAVGEACVGLRASSSAEELGRPPPESELRRGVARAVGDRRDAVLLVLLELVAERGTDPTPSDALWRGLLTALPGAARLEYKEAVVGATRLGHLERSHVERDGGELVAYELTGGGRARLEELRASECAAQDVADEEVVRVHGSSDDPRLLEPWAPTGSLWEWEVRRMPRDALALHLDVVQLATMYGEACGELARLRYERLEAVAAVSDVSIERVADLDHAGRHYLEAVRLACDSRMSDLKHELRDERARADGLQAALAALAADLDAYPCEAPRKTADEWLEQVRYGLRASRARTWEVAVHGVRGLVHDARRDRPGEDAACRVARQSALEALLRSVEALPNPGADDVGRVPRWFPGPGPQTAALAALRRLGERGLPRFPDEGDEYSVLHSCLLEVAQAFGCLGPDLAAAAEEAVGRHDRAVALGARLAPEVGRTYAVVGVGAGWDRLVITRGGRAVALATSPEEAELLLEVAEAGRAALAGRVGDGECDGREL